MLWINFLHIYQRANAENEHIFDATRESYIKIIKNLEDHPNVKFTMNISGCLFLRWDELGFSEIITRIKKLVERGQIELVGTVAYHPILPLIPEIEARRQIEEHELIIKNYIGDNCKLKGFFLPEMAYSEKVGKLLKKMGYKWVILDEISSENTKFDRSKVYENKNGLKIIFRSRKYSNSYVPQSLLKIINKKKTVITATDGEIYGLRHKDNAGYLPRLLSNKKVETCTVTEFINKQQTFQKLKIRSSNWESTEEELKKKKPFILWSDPDNKIHEKIWELAKLSLTTLEKFKRDKNYTWMRWHLVRGLSSCTFWWASGKDFRHVFGPIAWSPDEVEKNIRELIRAIRSIENKNAIKYKIKAEKLFSEILGDLWQNHWKKYS